LNGSNAIQLRLFAAHLLLSAAGFMRGVVSHSVLGPKKISDYLEKLNSFGSKADASTAIET
jgi:hypothetical protein